MTAKVRDVDKGFRKLREAAFGFGVPRISVGIHSSEGGEVHTDAAAAKKRLASGKKLSDKTRAKLKKEAQASSATLAEIAVWNEFGTKNTPPRSFIRAWFDENQTEAKRVFMRLMRQVLKGKLSRAQALDRFGLWAVGQIQKRMAAGIAPDNAASTIRRKGSSKPLIDTGQLRSAIGYAINGRSTKGVKRKKKVKPSEPSALRKFAGNAAKQSAQAFKVGAKVVRGAATKLQKDIKKGAQKGFKNGLRAVKKNAKDFRKTVRTTKKQAARTAKQSLRATQKNIRNAFRNTQKAVKANIRSTKRAVKSGLKRRAKKARRRRRAG